MNNEERDKLNILRQIKGAGGGLFPSQIKSFEGFNEWDGHDRWAITQLFGELEADGLIVRCDQSKNRTVGYRITDAGSHYLGHTGPKKGTASE
jgi:hypothetical protein